jgi:protein O-GlcNAc transferase
MSQRHSRELDEAISSFKRGEFDLARTQLDGILRIEHDNVDALKWFALASVKTGNFDAAGKAIARATTLGDTRADILLLASNIFQDLGDKTAALRYAQRTVEAAPNLAPGFNNLGLLLSDASRLDEAERAFRRAVAVNPAYGRAYANLASTLHRLGRLDNSLEASDAALRLQPDNAYAHFSRGGVLLQLGRMQEAESALSAALGIQPRMLDAWIMLARLYRRQFRFADASSAYDRVLAIAPDRTSVAIAKAEVIWAAGREPEARAMWRDILAQHPSNLECALRLHLSLPESYADVAHIEQSRLQFAEGLNELLQALPTFLTGSVAENTAAIQWSNFFLAYQGRNDLVLQKSYAQIVRNVLGHHYPYLYAPVTRHEVKDRRIRVGFAGAMFYESTAGYYFESWIKDLPRDEFDVTVFHVKARDDALTERIRHRADAFVQGETALIPLAKQIKEAELDLLIYPELGMDTKVFALASFRLAPIQICAWGHPVTSGHENVDYFFSCEPMEPASAATHYKEQLLFLPGIGTRYSASKPVSLNVQEEKRSLGLPVEKTLYLFPQSLFKIHPDNDPIVAEILRRDPRGVLVMFPGENPAASERYFARLGKVISMAGLTMVGRVICLKSVDHLTYKRVNAVCDVMLDTLYWSGGNTSLDALSVGLPIVTRPGEFMRGRQSMGMLSLMDLDELIARDNENFIRIALRLGTELEYRASVSQRILARHESIFDDVRPIQALHAKLRALAGVAPVASPL